MADNETQLGGLRVDGEGHTLHADHIDASIHAEGDVVGRDKITTNITHLHKYVQTIADDLEEAQAILAQGVQAYLDRLQAVAQQRTDVAHGNPYKGLHDYRLSDADHFFGRDDAIKELLTRMNTSALTILHAESGAGKSSLLKAGIANRLLGQGHLPLTVRPYDQSPTHAIKRDLIPNVASVPTLNEAPLHDFLRQVTQVLGPQTLLCLMLDQFEEFFTLIKDETVRRTFIDELARCLEDETLSVRWVLALRTEFFGELATFRPRIRHPFENDVRLNRLKLDEARQVITDPAENYQLAIEPELVGQILFDLHDEQTGEIAPPQIQLVCDSLYQRLTEGRQANPALPYALTLDMYENEGRAKSILGNYLNRVLTRTLTPPDRELAHRLLITLISSDRRRVRRTRSELAASLSPALPAAPSLDALLAQLVDSRLLTVAGDDDAGEGAYELAHDYLVGELELSPEMQAQKAAQEMLEQEVKAYQQFGTLLSEDKFAIINTQASALVLDDAAQELLRRSEAHHKAEYERELQKERENAARLRKRALIAGGVGIVAVIAAVVAGIFFFRAQESANEAIVAKETAEAEAMISRSRQLVTLSTNALNDNNPYLALLLALEAISTTETLESFDAVYDARANNHARRTFYGHTGWVNQATWSADESRVLTRSSDGSARIWDAESGAELIRLDGHTGEVWQATWSADDSRVLTTSADGTARIWDAESGAELVRLEGHTDLVNQATWSADESRVLTASADGSVRIWDADSGAELIRLDGHTDWVSQATWSVDESRVLTASADGSARIWDAKSGAELIYLDGHTGWVNQATWSADESRVLTRSSDGSARIWDAKSGTELVRLSGHTASVRQAAWSADESRVLTVGCDEVGENDFMCIQGTARIWDADSGAELIRLDGHTDWVNQATWNADDSRVLTTSADGTARIWDAKSGAELIRLDGHTGEVWQATWSADDSRVLTRSSDGTARIWDAESGAELVRLEGHTGWVNQATWSADGSRVLTASADGTARIWDAESRAEPVRLDLHTPWVHQATWSTDDSRVLTVSDDGTARIWNAESGAELLYLDGHTGGVWQAAWSADDSRVLIVSTNGSARIWDAESGAELVRLDGHTGRVWQAAWSADDSQVLTVGCDEVDEYGFTCMQGTARIWDAESGAELVRLEGHTSTVNQAAWSADGSRVLTASTDGTARIWDAESGAELVRLEGHTGWFNQATWSTDDSRVLTVGCDEVDEYGFTCMQGTARIWDAESGTELVRLESRTGGVSQVTWSTDDSRVLTANDDGTARIWDTKSGAELIRLEGEGGVWQATWSADESRVLTASADGTARIWDAESGAELVRLEGHTSTVNQATWSTDDSRVLTASADGTARIWDVDAWLLRETTCYQTARNMTWDEWRLNMAGTYRPTCANVPIPPDTIEGIVDNEVKLLAGQAKFEAAATRLAELLSWLEENHQYNTFGQPLEESLVTLRAGENPWANGE